jgi:hypothetical protein
MKGFGKAILYARGFAGVFENNVITAIRYVREVVSLVAVSDLDNEAREVETHRRNDNPANRRCNP